MSHRVASLDFLRGSAALAVTVPHFYMHFYPDSTFAETISILGVEVFFVLSGFVLAPQIIKFCVLKPSLRNYGIFLVRRWMRTVPPYLIALALFSISAHQAFTADFFRYLLYVQNLIGQHNAHDYFSIAWSLSVEEWFYLSFPALCLLIAYAVPGTLRPALITAFLYIFAVCTARILFGDNTQWGSAVRRVVVFRVDAIAWGFVLAIALPSLTKVRLPLALFLLVVSTSFAVWVTSLGAQSANSMMEFTFPFYAPGLGAVAILCAIKLESAVARNRTLSRVGIFLGQISYSTYLFHLLILSAVAPLSRLLPMAIVLVIYLIATAVVATLMYQAVEAPILDARPRFGGAARIPHVRVEPSSLTEIMPSATTSADSG
ncbi:acyltransferase [Bradyrhizobium frederickii]|uniref:Acyltransferase n=1 Tax=Bradyrhizobium frederickii TaxID=2560054 RepID=A0A4Y9NQC2_9BRAD|nr:acyltransferase [Bradyrhizobium frederickii]TFV69428.1 acyltransferase [Bradyrhizobium frederickii]